MDNITERRARLVELLAAAGRGSEQAFAELYDATHTYLYHVALRVLGTPAHAEEALQDAYLSIWQQARRYEPALGSAMAWLIAVVRNQAISTLRSQRMERHSVSLEDDAARLDDALVADEDATDPLHHVFQAAMLSRLPDALATLDPAQRQAIALTFHHGMAHAELAAHMGAPLGTVKSWLRRGMARLNTHFTQHASAAPQAAPKRRAGQQHMPMRC